MTYELVEPYRAFNVIGMVMFLVVHWLFTSHYLRMAVLFKLHYTEADLE